MQEKANNLAQALNLGSKGVPTNTYTRAPSAAGRPGVHRTFYPCPDYPSQKDICKDKTSTIYIYIISGMYALIDAHSVVIAQRFGLYMCHVYTPLPWYSADIGHGLD